MLKKILRQLLLKKIPLHTTKKKKSALTANVTEFIIIGYLLDQDTIMIELNKKIYLNNNNKLDKKKFNKLKRCINKYFKTIK